MKKKNILQKDLFGNIVHISNIKEVYIIVKCGNCGNIVKSSQAKTHITFGSGLTICNKCLDTVRNQIHLEGDN